jgi:uncharacterized protein YkwD
LKYEVQELSNHLREDQESIETTSHVEDPELSPPSEQTFSVHDIELGDERKKVEAELGRPKRESLNEYGVNWVTYHKDYHHFIMVAYNEKQEVSGLYTNQNLVSSTNGLTIGSSREEVLETLPEPLDAIRKGLVQYQVQNNGEYDVFDLDDSYVTVFYDIHQDWTVTAMLIIDRELEDQKDHYFAEASEPLREGFEYQLFDLTNATRVKHGASPLSWEESALTTVRDHSADMAENNYFSHTNLDGQSPFDRLSEDAIAYHMAGENLASGQPSSIFAHEGLMNSLGHRENKLKSGYQSLVVGVSFNEENQPFYTENYLAN